MTFEVKKEALEEYKRNTSTKELHKETDFLPSCAPETESPTQKVVKKPSSMRMSGASADRSLRVDSWVGGYAPDGFKKARRSWTAKSA